MQKKAASQAAAPILMANPAIQCSNLISAAATQQRKPAASQQQKPQQNNQQQPPTSHPNGLDDMMSLPRIIRAQTSASLACAVFLLCACSDRPARPDPMSSLLAFEGALKGPDANSNGVRDDIEAWIQSQNFTAERKAALSELAASIQAALLVDPANAAAVAASGARLRKASAAAPCSGASESDIRRMGNLALNSKLRVAAYLEYAAAFDAPPAPAPACPKR